MSALAYFLLVAVIILSFCLLLLRHGGQGDLDRDVSVRKIRISLRVKRPAATRASFDKNARPSRLTGCGQYVVRLINQFGIMSEPPAETLGSGRRTKSGWDSRFFFFNSRPESYT